jgi:hypothetical protein
VTRPGTVPPILRSALRSPGGKCYRHCDRPVRVRTISSVLPGDWQVRTCPSGVVSLTSYAEWSRRDPTRAVRRILEGWTAPRKLVRAWDLRLATRHGPELGRAAERFLATSGTAKVVRVVYWRVYPFRARDGSERRLFVCLRRTHRAPVFFAAPTTSDSRTCPVCGRTARARRRVGRRRSVSRYGSRS